MPISSSQITVTTSPTLLAEADGVAEGVYLHAKHEIFIGASDVTSSTGYEMDNGDKLTIHNHESPIYGIMATGTGTMSVLVVTK